MCVCEKCVLCVSGVSVTETHRIIKRATLQDKAFGFLESLRDVLLDGIMHLSRTGKQLHTDCPDTQEANLRDDGRHIKSTVLSLVSG